MQNEITLYIAAMNKQIRRLGRKPKKDADKVKVISAYLTYAEQKKVNQKYGNITNALRIEVLPKCETNE